MGAHESVRRFLSYASLPLLCLFLSLLLGTVLTSYSHAEDKSVNVRERLLKTLWVMNATHKEMEPLDKGPGKLVGGVSRVRIFLLPKLMEADTIRVGFSQERVLGAGPQWQVSGWMAATFASLETGEPLHRFQVLYDVEGRLEGLSAGALLTVGVMNALKNDPIRTDVTITGTINPDGTIGAVEGLLEKIEAAVKDNLKIILIPSIQNTIQDPSSGKQIDVVSFGQEIARTSGREDVKIIPVTGIQEAYTYFLPDNLSTPPQSRQGKTPSTPSLSSVQKAKLRSLINELRTLYTRERKSYETTTSGKDDNSKFMIDRAITLSESIERANFNLSRSYDEYLQAAHAAASARKYAELNSLATNVNAIGPLVDSGLSDLRNKAFSAMFQMDPLGTDSEKSALGML